MSATELGTMVKRWDLMGSAGPGMRWSMIVLAAVAMGYTAVVSAGSARADTQSYLSKLHDAGISTPRGELDVLEAGWEACELFDKGLSPDRVIQQSLYNSSSHPFYGLTPQQADTVLHLAVTELCSARK
jgi:hypothetical protein